MPQVAAYSLAELIPIGPTYSEAAYIMSPNQTLNEGVAVGQVTSASAQEVQTITTNHTGGTRRLGITTPNGVQYTGNLAHNASNAVTQAALVALLGAGTVVVTGTPDTNIIITWQANGPQPLIVIDQSLATGGTADTIAETTPGILQYSIKPYVHGNTDGTGNLLGVMKEQWTCNALGQMSPGTSTTGDQQGSFAASVPVFVQGRFWATDLSGVDANGLSGRGMLEAGPLTGGSAPSTPGIVRLF